MEILYRILEVINYIVIGISTVTLAFQVVFIAFTWLKPKKFDETKKLNRIAVAICAHNEEDVIYNTVKSLFDKQKYPRDLYKVYVIAHNCNDATAELAKKAGAEVIIYNNPATKIKSYPLVKVSQRIIEDNSCDFVIYLDADTLLKDNYFIKMNDAFNAGVKCARPFEDCSNFHQNNWAKVSAAYYVRDSRISSNFRERIGVSSMLCGAGMMVSYDVLKIKGWDAMGASEDAEYTLNRIMDGVKVHYVSEAIVYEEQTSNAKDTFNRMTRMGNGLWKLFWNKGFIFLGNFFKKPNFSNIDLFIQLLFIPVGIMCVIWFPLYYIFYAIIHLVNGFIYNFMPTISGLDGQLFTAQFSQGIILKGIGLVILVLSIFYFVFAFQTWLALFFSKENLGVKTLKGYWSAIWLTPLFMIFYDIGISWGIITNAGWKKINRNKNSKN